MFQGIITKYLGPTNTRGARVRATASAGTIMVPWDYALNPTNNHKAAAQALALRYGWAGNWYGGGLPGSGYAFVQVLDGQAPSFIVPVRP